MAMDQLFLLFIFIFFFSMVRLFNVQHIFSFQGASTFLFLSEFLFSSFGGSNFRNRTRWFCAYPHKNRSTYVREGISSIGKFQQSVVVLWHPKLLVNNQGCLQGCWVNVCLKRVISLERSHEFSKKEKFSSTTKPHTVLMQLSSMVVR